MTWILIMTFVSVTGGVANNHVEFDDKAACFSARDELLGTYRDFIPRKNVFYWFTCVPKGTPKDGGK